MSTATSTAIAIADAGGFDLSKPIAAVLASIPFDPPPPPPPPDPDRDPGAVFFDAF